MASFLDQYDASTDRVAELRLMAHESHGIDIRGVYCLHTGKQIGEYDSDEILEAIYEEGDLEDIDLIDSLCVRVVASMRPSPALNKPDKGTIREMVARRPVDACAYLLNRLYGSKFLLTARGDDSFAPLYQRIETHKKLSLADPVMVSTLTHWLLELDSKMNLHEVIPPVFTKLKDSWAATKTGTQLLNLLNDLSILPAFESWVFARLQDWDARDTAQLKERNWARGNTMTDHAFVRSYLDNPEIANRKHADELKRKERVAKSKPQSAKTQLMNAKVSAASGLLDQLLSGALSIPVENLATPKPKLRLSLNLLGSKKESN